MRGDKERGMMKSKLKGGSEASLVRLAVRVEGGNRGNTVGSRMRMRDRIPIEDFSSPTPNRITPATLTACDRYGLVKLAGENEDKSRQKRKTQRGIGSGKTQGCSSEQTDVRECVHIIVNEYVCT
jgi:hypothetical protein